jgi:hypothetical protein
MRLLDRPRIAAAMYSVLDSAAPGEDVSAGGAEFLSEQPSHTVAIRIGSPGVDELECDKPLQFLQERAPWDTEWTETGPYRQTTAAVTLQRDYTLSALSDLINCARASNP